MTPTRLVLPAAAVVAAAAIVLSLAALGSAASTATTVAVTMTEFKFALSKTSVPRGVVTFRVTNKGAIGHDFKIAGTKTPIYPAGKGGILRVTFKKAGSYPYSCGVPGHSGLGMKGVLRVT